VRFLRRVYTMVWRWHERLSNSASAPVTEGTSAGARELRRKTHQTIAKVTSDFEGLHMNTIVAALMELFNELSDLNADPAMASEEEAYAVKEALESLVLMLAPFSPHVAEEMWEQLGHAGGLLQSARWPQADAELARREELEIPIQVNGKLRSRVLARPEVTEEELRTAALNDEKIQAVIDGHEVVKVIVVPQRLVNVVVK
jgi:leucyl-tRNA synthetase